MLDFSNIVQGLLVVTTGSGAAMLFRVNQRLAKLELSATPLWSTLQLEVSRALHHPDPESAPMDKLLVKLEKLELNEAETVELDEMLEIKMKNPKESDQERKRAELLRFIMPRVVQQAADKLELTRRVLNAK